MDIPAQSVTAAPMTPWYRKYWYVEVLVVIVVAAVAVWLAYQPAMDFSLRGPSSVAVGEEFSVSLMSDSDAYTVTAAALVFTYDATKLQLQAMTPGTLLSTVLTPVSMGSGRATVTVGSGTSAIPGPGTLAVLSFKAIASGAALVSVDPASQAAASGEKGNVLPALPALMLQVR
jgi:hypothetical protein